MKRNPILPDDYCYAIDDGKTMHCWNPSKEKKSLPKGRRKSADTNRAKALLRKLGL
ncbi:MAG: hypothetical protein OJF50_002500 [Nitrospira sp.]|jgi:hypothetical protein|nr:hypothetical protein [Nitrospira sp.]